MMFCKQSVRSTWLRGAVLLSVLAVALVGSQARAETTWEAGAARMNINPAEPLWLAGYGGRERPVSKVIHDIHARAVALGIIDETSDDKNGTKTPGVQRQHLGCSGKQDNGIVTVNLAYAADDFHCLLDGELFLPNSWSDDRDRCREAGIPDEMVYRPKSETALELYDRANANGVKFSWLTFDEWIGRDPLRSRRLDLPVAPFRPRPLGPRFSRSLWYQATVAHESDLSSIADSLRITFRIDAAETSFVHAGSIRRGMRY